MWSVIPCLETLLQGLSVVFTQPSAVTFHQVFLGWIMCLGRRTEFRVFEALEGEPVCRNSRHPFDRFYNFFSRSAWSVPDLGRQLAIKIVVALNRSGVLELIVDSTLLHKSGAHVFGIGWFHDPVASTKKRVATALGNQWTVLGLAIRIPGVGRIFCLPIHAILQQPGKGKPSPADSARRMLADALAWFPGHKLILIGDGGFSAKTLLKDLDERVTYVGLMRGDAALHDTKIPPRRGKSGPKPKYGPRLPNPRKVAGKADRARSKNSRWRWKRIKVDAYGKTLKFKVCAFQAVWPRVLGSRPIQVVVCRPLEAGYDEVCLFTTQLDADPVSVIATYASRSSIEAAFKDSKQVMEIQKPQHWCQQSIEKLAPCVWFMQSLIQLWYFTTGHELPEAKAARNKLGPWDSEYSLRHMLRLLRQLTLRELITLNSPNKRDLHELIHQLENYLSLAA
jgi:DDE superfamily endonuclease